MTRTSLVAMTIITLGLASNAFAQSADDNAYLNRSPRPTIIRMDPLDPVSRVAMLATRANGDVIAAPAPMPQPQVTQIADERPAGPSRFFSALNGISAGLAVSHEALDVYEHAIEANALKNSYNGR